MAAVVRAAHWLPGLHSELGPRVNLGPPHRAPQLSPDHIHTGRALLCCQVGSPSPTPALYSEEPNLLKGLLGVRPYR